MRYDPLKSKLPCFTTEQEYSPYTPAHLRPHYSETSVYAKTQASTTSGPTSYFVRPDLQEEERMAWLGEELDRVFAKK